MDQAETSSLGSASPQSRSLTRDLTTRLEAWRLRRRRARVTKRRTTGRRTQIVFGLILVVLLGAFAWAISYVYLSGPPEGTELTFDQLSALADEKRIGSAVFLDEDTIVTGTYSAPAPIEEEKPKAVEEGRKGSKRGGLKQTGGERAKGSGKEVAPEPEVESVAPPGAGTYWVDYPAENAVTAVLVEMATSAGARVSVDPQSSKQAVRIVSTFLLPLMILATLFGLLFTSSRGGGGGIGEVMMFGTIGKRGYRKGRGSSVSFADVAGADEAVAELKEVRDYLQDPRKYEDIGAAPPKGVLLVGPPGCGKTLLAKAVAGEAEVPFFSVAGAEFVESLVGVGAARVRDLFQRVRAVAPAIVFIDELDAAGRRRGTGGSSGGSDEREQTLNQLLVEMDGFDVSTGIVVVGATNRPDILDPALLRPGRFDRHVTVDQPDHEGRRLILELHARGKPIAPTVDFDFLAKRTPGFSGADLANVINEAALLTVRENKPEIDMDELQEAVQRVLTGPKKKGRVLSPEERNRAAYHESGHAIVTTALGRAEEVHRVSILARGRGLGLASLRRETEAVLFTRRQLFGQIITAMGGISSEVLIFGEPSTGAEQDLERATELARDMVGRFGMGARRQRLLARDVEEFLGNEVGLQQLSPQTHQEVEAEIERLLDDAEKEATRLLKTNRKSLEALAKRLLTEEHLEGAELDNLLKKVAVDERLAAPLPSDLIEGNGQIMGSSEVTRSSKET